MEKEFEDRWSGCRDIVNEALRSTSCAIVNTKEEIYQLTDDDLRAIGGILAKSSWGGLSSQRNFSDFYSIHQSNFSAWLSGKRGNPQARRAIIRFMTETPTEKEINDFIAQKRSPTKFNEVSASRAIPRDTQAPKALHEYQIYCFIDGDNAIHSLYSLVDIPINKERVKVYSFHNAAFRSSKQFRELKSQCPWLDMQFAEEPTREGADHFMSFQVGVLCGVLSVMASSKKKVYLVSQDKFLVHARDAAKRSGCCDVELLDGSRHLGYELYNLGYGAPNFDIAKSQFHYAITSIIERKVEREREVIMTIHEQWPKFEQRNKLEILPFTSSMIYTALKGMSKMKLESKVLVIPLEDFQLAVKDLRHFLIKQPQQTATVDTLEKELANPSELYSWRQLLEANTILLEYGIVYAKETDSVTQTSVFKSTKMIKQNVPRRK